MTKMQPHRPHCWQDLLITISTGACDIMILSYERDVDMAIIGFVLSSL